MLAWIALAYAMSMLVWLKQDLVQLLAAAAAGGTLAIVFAVALGQFPISKQTWNVFNADSVGVAIAAGLSLAAYGLGIWLTATGVDWLLHEFSHALRPLPESPSTLASPFSIPPAAWVMGAALGALVTLDAWGLHLVLIGKSKPPRESVAIQDLGKKLVHEIRSKSNQGRRGGR